MTTQTSEQTQKDIEIEKAWQQYRGDQQGADGVSFDEAWEQAEKQRKQTQKTGT